MRHLLLVLAICFGTTSFAQNTKDTLEKATLDYFETVESNDFDAMLDAMHPDVFKTVPKENMKKGMEQMINNDQMAISFLSSDLKSISKLVVDGESTFALVAYTNDMKMTFNEAKTLKTEEKTQFMEYMKSTLEQQFGEGKVKIAADKISLLSTIDGTIYGIYNIDFGGWKFLGNDPNMSDVVNGIIPESVRIALNE